MDKEDGDKWRMMELDERMEMNGLGLRLELELGFRDRV